jgi:hypothetical protein
LKNWPKRNIYKLFSPLQSAAAVGEPRDTECLGIFDELRDTIRDPASSSLVPGYTNGRRLEQLSLRAFARNNRNSLLQLTNGGGIGGAGTSPREEDNGRAEPVPQVMVLSSAEREPVSVPPTALRHWEQLELMPICQPKDVLYLAVVPDVNVLAEKCKVFLEEMSR